MDMSILEKPFDPALVKTRRGAFGQTLSYVEGAEYVRRLNEAFAGAWSFEVVSHSVHEAEVVVLGKLTAGGVVKTAFGGSSITTHSETGERISLADDLKSASTDALKKACSMFGIGLHLHSDAAPTTKQPKPTGNSRTHARTVQTSTSNGSNGTEQRLTQAQLSAIFKMARKLRMNAEDVRARSTELYGAVVEQLSKADASRMITELADELGGCPV